jgi:hypothetical protein
MTTGTVATSWRAERAVAEEVEIQAWRASNLETSFIKGVSSSEAS